jgi:hypothetical protein
LALIPLTSSGASVVFIASVNKNPWWSKKGLVDRRIISFLVQQFFYVEQGQPKGLSYSFVNHMALDNIKAKF